jgi:uncharacterized protein (TIGR03435 family)
MYGFTIEAQPPEDDSLARPTVEFLREQFPQISLLRLRALLIDRFHLQYHLEMRETVTYELVVAKNGPKMQKKPFDENIPLACSQTKIESTGRPISELAAKLGEFYLGTDVVDKTGLEGNYAYQFSFQPRFTAPSPDGEPLPSIFDAIKDIGLNLVPVKKPLQFLVIDHFDQPTAN